MFFSPRSGFPHTPSRSFTLIAAALICLAVLAPPAMAERLMVDPAAPGWMHFGAAVLLYIHIGGGTLGLVTGTAAILSPKGRPFHRAMGRIFFVSMMACYAVGAGVAPFLETGQRPNFVAGVMALYLLLTAWRAARNRNAGSGWPEYLGLATALVITAMGALFMYQGSQDPSGTVDGSPPQAFILFVATGAAAALGEINVILRGGITGPARIGRHLWRMCMSLFIAAGSFFLGQQQMLPDAMVGSPLQIGAVVFPLIAIPVWLVLSRLKARRPIAQ